MSVVGRNTAFPLFAVVLGCIGSACLLFGMLGHFNPGAVSFAPALRESHVSTALIMTGVILLTVELALILPWIQRRSTVSRDQ